MERSEAKFLSIFMNPDYPNLLSMSDGSLWTDDGCLFPIHRSVLALKSQYFHAMFTEMGVGRKEFRIPAMSGKCLSDILCYLYRDDICLTEGNIADLLIGADYLLLKDMCLRIKQNVKTYITKNNCLKIFQAAYMIDDEGIMKQSMRFIQTGFERIISDHPTELEDLPPTVLISILSTRSLYVYDETTVWKVIIQWTQKDSVRRKASVPQLLSCLALEEVDEQLAAEILHHEIVSNNQYMGNLKDMKRSSDSANNRDVLVQLLQNYSDDLTKTPHYSRIPQKLSAVVTWSFTKYRRVLDVQSHICEGSSVYVTYDENVDLWCKILEVDFEIAFMTVIGHNIFILENFPDSFGEMVTCWEKFSLISMGWIPMEHVLTVDCRGRQFIVEIDVCIYLFHCNESRVKIYDTEIDVWFLGAAIPCHRFFIGGVATIDDGIFIVGDSYGELIGVTLIRLHVVTGQWILLPSPNHTYEREIVVLVAYHKKIYLVGNLEYMLEENYVPTSKAEVFDPEVALWEVLPDFPYTCDRYFAAVLCDQLYIYGESRGRKVIARWDESSRCWEKVENFDERCTDLLANFFTIEDADVVRTITKRNRRENVELEDIRFPFNTI